MPIADVQIELSHRYVSLPSTLFNVKIGHEQFCPVNVPVADVLVNLEIGTAEAVSKAIISLGAGEESFGSRYASSEKSACLLPAILGSENERVASPCSEPGLPWLTDGETLDAAKDGGFGSFL